MRGTFFAGALAAGVLLAGAGPATRDRWRQRHLREAAQGRLRRRHPVPPGRVQPVRGAQRRQPAGGHAGPRALGGLRRAEREARRATRRAGRTSRTTSTRWGTGRSRSSTSSAARATSRASAGRSSAATSARWSTPPSGDVTGPVWAADLSLPPSPAPNTSTSGCEAADFAGMPKGAIVLIQRGTCGELTKWLNAQAAGAGAIVYINEGNAGRARARGPALVRHGGRGRARSRSRPRRSRPSPTSPAASARASSARPSLPDRLAHGPGRPDPERHRRDPRRGPEQGDRRRRAPRQRRHRPGHQRQRLRLGGAARVREASCAA